MSKRPVELLLQDIRDAIDNIESYILSMSKIDFLNDKKTIDAVVRNLEIIGEAANRLPEEYRREKANIPWRSIIGLRHRIVHDYIGIDAELIWQIVKRDVPILKGNLPCKNRFGF